MTAGVLIPAMLGVLTPPEFRAEPPGVFMPAITLGVIDTVALLRPLIAAGVNGEAFGRAGVLGNAASVGRAGVQGITTSRSSKGMGKTLREGSRTTAAEGGGAEAKPAGVVGAAGDPNIVAGVCGMATGASMGAGV